MNPAWIDLTCPDCDEDWEAELADLPPADEDFTCPHCASSRPTGEFTRTTRDFEILQEFHAE